jgi:hypothetical protein
MVDPAVTVFRRFFSCTSYVTFDSMNELIRMWKEAVVATLEPLSQNLAGVSEENHEQPWAG